MPNKKKTSKRRKTQGDKGIPWVLSYATKWTFDDFQVVGGNIRYSPSNAALTVSPTSCQGWTSLTGVFDEYRITKVEAMFMVSQPEVGTQLWFTHDRDGGVVLPYAEMASRPNKKIRVMTPDRPFTTFTVHNPGVIQGGIDVGTSKIDCASPKVHNLGFIGALAQTTSGTYSLDTVLTATVHFRMYGKR